LKKSWLAFSGIDFQAGHLRPAHQTSALGLQVIKGFSVQVADQQVRCLQCGEQPQNATAVTFHFAPRFRPSVSPLGFDRPSGPHLTCNARPSGPT
jgi:hypothetical protein